MVHMGFRVYRRVSGIEGLGFRVMGGSEAALGWGRGGRNDV